MTPSLFRDGNLRRDRGKRCSRTRRDAPRRGDLFQPGLRRAAGLAVPASTGADEEEVLANLGKLTHVGDPLRLGLWRRLLRGETAWTPRDRRLCDMLWVVLYGGKLAASGEAAVRFKRHQAVRAELAELIEVLERLNGVLAPKHELAAAVPLVLHTRYLAGELAAGPKRLTVRGSDQGRGAAGGVVHRGRGGQGRRARVRPAAGDAAESRWGEGALAVSGFCTGGEEVSLAVQGGDDCQALRLLGPRAGLGRRDSQGRYAFMDDRGNRKCRQTCAVMRAC